jgi:hypothetical protein
LPGRLIVDGTRFGRYRLIKRPGQGGFGELPEIRDQSDYTVPSGPAEEPAELFKAITAE